MIQNFDIDSISWVLVKSNATIYVQGCRLGVAEWRLEIKILGIVSPSLVINSFNSFISFTQSSLVLQPPQQASCQIGPESVVSGQQNFHQQQNIPFDWVEKDYAQKNPISIWIIIPCNQGLPIFETHHPIFIHKPP